MIYMNKNIHVQLPYIICPFCGEQITCKPDFEFYLTYLTKFGGLGKPHLKIQKTIPVHKIITDPNLLILKQSLRDFSIKIAHKQPLFCTAILTSQSYESLNKLIELGIVQHKEIYDE